MKEIPESMSAKKTTKINHPKTDRSAAHNQQVNSRGASYVRSQRYIHNNKPKVLYGSGAQSSTKSESFKVGADHNLHDEMFISENWPQGTSIRRYKFFQNEH